MISDLHVANYFGYQMIEIIITDKILQNQRTSNLKIELSLFHKWVFGKILSKI